MTHDRSLLDPALIARVRERALVLAAMYHAGSAWGASDIGFICERLVEIVDALQAERNAHKPATFEGGVR